MKPGTIFHVMIAVLTAAVISGPGLLNPVYGQQTADKKDPVLNEFSEGEVTGWRIRDFKPYVKAIEELEKLNKEYSDNLLKLAIDEYSTALDILEDMENEVIKLKTANKEKKNLGERWYWQEIDRKNAEQRQVAGKKYEAKMKSVTYLTKSINYLDKIQHPEIRNEPRFMNFQSRLYQVYVSTEYDLQNFLPCIAILERYITLSDKNAKDIWAYKYMASCYGYMEKVLTKYKHASEDEITKYKSKKNRSMLQAVELKYGIESPHYKHMQEIVEQDEKRSERINDFK
jgi:hypothetical protein